MARGLASLRLEERHLDFFYRTVKPAHRFRCAVIARSFAAGPHAADRLGPDSAAIRSDNHDMETRLDLSPNGPW